MTWSWWGFPGLLALIIATACAAILWRLPGSAVNRHLARVLVLEGIFVAGSLGVLFFLEGRQPATAVAVAGAAAGAALPFQYLLFLGRALQTPLVAPFRSRLTRIALGVLSILAAAGVAVRPDFVIADLYSPGWAPWNFTLAPTGLVVIALQGAVSLFGLIAAIAAFSRSPKGTAAHTRALWFVAAFGVRDAFAATIQILLPVLRPIPFWGDFIYNPLQGTSYVLYVGLLAYGVLNYQLFDIDLKIKIALKGSTVAAAFGGAFFLASEVLEQLLPVEGLVLGLLAATAVVLLLKPLERFAQRLVNRIMKDVVDTPQYLLDRKLRVYAGALEGAIEDGVIHEDERHVLDSLRTQLGLTFDQTRHLERNLLARPAS